METDQPRNSESRPLLAARHSVREERPPSPRRSRLYEIIFEADTRAGKAFDVALLVAIVLSVIAVMLESVAEIRLRYGALLYAMEWFFTILFSIEYILRLVSVRRPLRYALSFFGMVDFLAVIPTYLGVVLSGAQTLLILRVFRLLRVFRVFKLTRFIGEAHLLKEALSASRYKITVFILTVLSVVVTVGATMYLVEGPASGFTSIPRAIYWAIVTMTTVGYGDIAPQTVPGQAIAALLMVLGYGIIAVPTGIVTAELTQAYRKQQSPETCPGCGRQGHDDDAVHCKICGIKL
jgi:voltage-gated potassium channel